MDNQGVILVDYSLPSLVEKVYIMPWCILTLVFFSSALLHFLRLASMIYSSIFENYNTKKYHGKN